MPNLAIPLALVSTVLRWGWFGALACCLLVATLAQPAFYQNPDDLPASRFQAESAGGMVASSSLHASTIGLQVLHAGGNAADAAIAVSFAISVTRPQSTGLGGGGFLLYYDAASGAIPVFDFREKAPAKASRDMYVRNGKAVPELSRVGKLAVGVPGTVAGLVAVHEKFGSKPLPQLIAPAYLLARDGFPVYPELARRIDGKKEALAADPAMKAVFFSPAGVPLAEGELLRQPDLAQTLATLMEKGRAGFYQGWVAEALARDGGLMTTADLDSYEVAMREPVRGTYRGYEVVSMPPPSSGGTHLVQMLNVLQHWNLKSHGLHSLDTVHLLAETMRSAYTDRAEYMGDSDFVDVPLKWITSQAYAREVASQIPLDRARKSATVLAGRPLVESPETTHISIVDQAGNAVSTTQTINFGFGACIMAKGTGIILNNEMDDFSAQPGVPNLFGLVGGDANAIAPGKRPLSSMTPTFLLRDGKPVLVLGAPGGSKIITAVLQTIVNVVDYELPVYEAVAKPRMHHQALPDVLQLEQGYFSEPLRVALTRRGHEVQEVDRGFGQVQAIAIGANGMRRGASDPRVGGAALGQ